MSAFVHKNMYSKRVCVFVDGENLRHSLVNLFSSFDQRSYLPTADWSKFFDWISRQVAGENAERVRTYWYVVQQIDYSPYNLHAASKDKILLKSILSRNAEARTAIEKVSGKDQDLKIEKISKDLQECQTTMEKRFNGWINIQDEISRKCVSIEFRRAGTIRYDLYDRSLGSEKAVDVKLATDLIRLKDIYDIAVIVSGDGDYVPAVEAIKDAGKHAVNVAFLTENGNLLPGGAKRLNQATDRSIEIEHADLKKHL